MRQLLGDEVAQRGHGRGSGRELDERQRLRGLQEDRPADLGAEGLAVEDHAASCRPRC